MVKFSIITINFNNRDGLQKTMDSVVNQTYQDFEYIVIDGGSIDNSVDCINLHKHRLSYWISEPDSGIYSAMNKGIKNASGRYLLFLNSGDFFENKYVLEKASSFVTDFDFVYFDLRIITSDKSYIKTYSEKLTFSIVLSDSLPHPATFIKREVFQNYGYYNENFKIVSDWKFFIERICRDNCTYVKVPFVLSVFNTDGVSSDIKNKKLIAEEKQQVLNENFSAFLPDIDELNILRRTIGELKTSRKIRLLMRLKLLNPF